MNIAYLIVPIIVGVAIGASVFIFQRDGLTGLVVLPNISVPSGEEIQNNSEEEIKCPPSCDDDNPCTADWCDKSSNYACSHLSINGTSKGCWGNPTACATNSCVSGKCVQISIKTCCGNGVCESSESCLSCSSDCGACPPAETSNQIQTPQLITEQPQQPSQSTVITNNNTSSSQTGSISIPNQTNATQNAQTLNHVIISEVQAGPNEFVELYNPANADVDATGWYLSYFSSNRDWNNTYRNWVFPNNTILRAGKFFLINIFNTSNSDWTVLTSGGSPYSQGQISNNGSIGLFPFDPRYKGIEEARDSRIDAIGWGSPAYVFESTPATAPENGKSVQRTSLNADTDNNSQDFSLNDSPTPRNSS